MDLIRVLIADDHALIREGLTRVLGLDPAITVIGEAAHGLDAVEKVRRLAPDVVLMDLHMPQMGGLEAARVIKEEFPHIRVIALTVDDREKSVLEVFGAGVSGYILKDIAPEALNSTIRAVYAGETVMDQQISRMDIGMAPVTLFTGATTALAAALTLLWLSPHILAKARLTCFVDSTVISLLSALIVTVGELTPFFWAYSAALVVAAVGLSGSSCTPASAAASTACTSLPRSTSKSPISVTSEVNPRNTVKPRATSTITVPSSFLNSFRSVSIIAAIPPLLHPHGGLGVDNIRVAGKHADHRRYNFHRIINCHCHRRAPGPRTLNRVNVNRHF